jgi:hemerythrin
MPMTAPRAELSTGFPAFDALHRACYEAIDQASLADDATFPAALECMLGHLAHMFRVEDGWMEESGHAALLSHREQHSRVLGALHHVQAAVMQGDLAVGRHAIDDLLPNWLALHIDTLDTVLSIALRFDERRRPTPRLYEAPAAV